MAQASDIFSHLRQNQETCAKIMATCARIMETCTRIMETCTGNMETCARIMDTCTALLATSVVTLPRQHRHSAAPAPSLRRTSTVTSPRQHCHSAAPAPSLCRTRSVILAAAKPGETLSGIVTEVKSLTWDFAGSSTKWPENA